MNYDVTIGCCCCWWWKSCSMLVVCRRCAVGWQSRCWWRTSRWICELDHQ